MKNLRDKKKKGGKMRTGLRVADFFCGAGGFSEGFRQKGFDVVFGLDNWKPAVDTHRLNHPESKTVLMDILDLDTPEEIDSVVPDVEVIIGSPPCVSFSGSNKAGKADKSLGILLIEAYLRVILWKKSRGVLKYWILENVPNSRHYIKERYSWRELGLPGNGPDLVISTREVLNATDYGAPQGRKRFFCGEFQLPKKTHEEDSWVTMRKVLESLGNPLSEAQMKIADPVYMFEIDGADLTDHFYDSRVADFEWKNAKRLKEDHGFMGKMSFPENLDRPSRTVMATMSASTRESMIFDSFDKDGRHNGYRLPTIREIASFMSFPITYQFEARGESTKYKLVGNAVCCKMAAALAESILINEGTIPPKYSVPLPIVFPKVNLNGSKRSPKKSRPKKADARFARHIPNLKIKGWRVELTNKKSQFNEGDICWSCLLHKGTGKSMVMLESYDIDVKELSKRLPNGTLLIEDIEENFRRDKITSESLQENLCLNGDAEGLTPDVALEIMKGIIDKHYPEERFSEEYIDNKDSLIKIKSEKIPLRVVAGLIACDYFVRGLKKDI